MGPSYEGLRAHGFGGKRTPASIDFALKLQVKFNKSQHIHFVCTSLNRRSSHQYIMVNKCSVGNCKSNYSSQKSPYIPVYKLPDDLSERDTWIAALPNKVNSTSNVRICRLHWLSGNIPMIKKRRFARPRDPPSIFNVHTEILSSTNDFIITGNI